MHKRLFSLLILVVVFLGVWALQAQSEAPPQEPAEEKSSVKVGGPKRPVGATVAVPWRPPPLKTKRRMPAAAAKPGEQPFNIAVNVDLVTVDVLIRDRRGRFLGGLTKKHFRILEDGVPQQVQTFEHTKAPMTVVLVIEFNNLFQRFWSETWYQTLTAAYGFLNTLRPEDWVAVVAYDLKAEILQDFTQNKKAAYAAMQRLRFPSYSEANLYDTLDEVLTRLNDVPGKKGIVLISTGIDTFSKLTYGKILKKVRYSEVPIYPVGMMQVMRMRRDSRGHMSPIDNMTFLQSDNALRYFAEYSGGRAFFPRFYGEFPSIFHTISHHMRNQYTLGYVSSNPAHDGKFRKLKVQLVGENGKKLKIMDRKRKGKEIKYKIHARAGYIAPKGEMVVQ